MTAPSRTRRSPQRDVALTTIPPGTPCFADVLLYVARARDSPEAEAERVLDCARNIIRNHALLDWRDAFAREHVDAAIVAALLD